MLQRLPAEPMRVKRRSWAGRSSASVEFLVYCAVMKTRPTKIAIFSGDEALWSLPAWTALFPRLIKKYEVAGIFLFPGQLGNKKGLQVHFWYWRVFGFLNFIVFVLFAIRCRVLTLLNPAASADWKALAKKYSVPLQKAATPNEESVIAWVQKNEIDVIFIMVNHILKKDILNAPRVGIINKHAALLPSARGVYPFFWCKLKGLPTGVTYHQVDAGIDTGPILLQTSYPADQKRPLSMLRFYAEIYHLFPEMALLAFERLLQRDYRPADPALKGCYFSTPTREDSLNFQKAGHKIARFSDLFYRPTMALDLTRL